MMAQPYCGFMPEEVFVRPQCFQPSDPISELLIRSVHYRTLSAKNHQADIFSAPPSATEAPRAWPRAL